MTTKTVPPWLVTAAKYLGFHEVGNNQGLDHFITLAKTGSEGDPWCAIFMNACLEESGFPGTRSAAANSWTTSSNFIPLPGPEFGCITTMSRTGGNHVYIYLGENEKGNVALGGNQSDAVNREYQSKAPVTGYWWPKSYPVPTDGPVKLPTATALTGPIWPTDYAIGTAAVATAPVAEHTTQTRYLNIMATTFGGTSDKNTSAYDNHLISDTELGCALPYRFKGDRPQVRVYANGKSCVVSIVDVGPWNINDPYWTTNSRPEAESGTDNTGRKVAIPAGIDLTPGAVNALGIKWNKYWSGTVDWEFVSDASSPAEPVTPDSTVGTKPVATPTQPAPAFDFGNTLATIFKAIPQDQASDLLGKLFTGLQHPAQPTTGLQDAGALLGNVLNAIITKPAAQQPVPVVGPDIAALIGNVLQQLPQDQAGAVVGALIKAAPVVEPIALGAIDKLIGGSALVGSKTALGVLAGGGVSILQALGIMGTAFGAAATPAGSIITIITIVWTLLGLVAKLERPAA